MKRKLVSVEEFAAKLGVESSVVMDEILRRKFRKSVVRDEMGRIQIILYDGVFEWKSKDDKTVDKYGVPLNVYGDIRGTMVEAMLPDDDDKDI